MSLEQMSGDIFLTQGSMSPRASGDISRVAPYINGSRSRISAAKTLPDLFSPARKYAKVGSRHFVFTLKVSFSGNRRFVISPCCLGVREFFSGSYDCYVMKQVSGLICVNVLL